MAYEIKDNSGSLFVNDKREKDTQPTHKGDAKIDGKLYWVSAWYKETKSGQPMFSMSFKEKEAVNAEGLQKAKAAVESKPEPSKDFYDDGDIIPF